MGGFFISGCRPMLKYFFSFYKIIIKNLNVYKERVGGNVNKVLLYFEKLVRAFIYIYFFLQSL